MSANFRLSYNATAEGLLRAWLPSIKISEKSEFLDLSLHFLIGKPLDQKTFRSFLSIKIVENTHKLFLLENCFDYFQR